MLKQSSGEGPLIVLPGDAEKYLAKLEIDVAAIQDAMREGYLAASNLDDFYPSTARGFYLWATANATLRREHVRDNPDWKSVNESNRPLLKNVAAGYTLTACGGDSGTGDRRAAPNVRRGKGSATRSALVESQCQLSIPLPGINREASTPEPNDAPPAGEWFVLYRERQDRVAAEVSFPTGMSGDGFVEGWAVRVLLDDIELGGEIQPLPEIDGGYDVDFRIEEA